MTTIHPPSTPSRISHPLQQPGSPRRAKNEVQAYSRTLRRSDVLTRMAARFADGVRSIRDRIVSTVRPMSHEQRLERQVAAQLLDMDKNFGHARAEGYSLPWQTVRDLEGNHYSVKVDGQPEKFVSVTPYKARRELTIAEGSVTNVCATLKPTDNLGTALSTDPELLKKALYFATQEVVALVEEALTVNKSSPVVKAVGQRFSFAGSPTLNYKITTKGDEAAVAISYSRKNISMLATPANFGAVETDPDQTKLELNFELRVKLGEATRFVPGSTKLSFSILRTGTV